MNRLVVFFWRLRSWVVRAIVPRRTVDSRGLRFTLQCDNWITYYRWQSYNTKEPETLDWVDQWVRAGDTVFDIGSNIGVYAIYTALRHQPVRVIAFEPEYANLHMLRDNVVLNGLQDMIDIYSIALSRDSGPNHLYIQDFTPGAALHSVSNDKLNVTYAKRAVVGREGIWVTTMDSFCEKTGLFPHCIKIDVDGTELEILEGGKQTLRAHSVRSVIIEMPSETDLRGKCQMLLEEAGLMREWSSAQSPNEVWGRR